jgi:curved DNA-binding protein CbpA
MTPTMSNDVRRPGARDPHDLLGVPKGANRQQVIRAFHRKARRGGHPDTGGSAQTFEEIVHARDVLLDQSGRTTHNYAYRTARPTPTAPTPTPETKPRQAPASWSTRQTRPTGPDSDSLVPFFLLVFGVLALPFMLRILSLILIP